MSKYGTLYAKVQQERRAAERKAAEQDAAERALRMVINENAIRAKKAMYYQEVQEQQQKAAYNAAKRFQEAEERERRAEEAVRNKRAKTVNSILRSIIGLMGCSVVVIFGFLIGAVDFWYAATVSIGAALALIGYFLAAVAVLKGRRRR